MIFQLLGVLFLVIGVLFIFKPDLVKKIGEWGQKLLFQDRDLVQHNVATGIFFLVVATLMFLFASWVAQWNLSAFFRRFLS